MSRLKKATLTALFVLLVVLPLTAWIILKTAFTEERILAMLTPRLEAALNRPVHISRAGVGIWGGIGIWVGDLTVANAPGFSDEPLLALHRFDVKARFWPLLAGRVEIDRLEVTAPSLLLERSADGHVNWANLLSDSAKSDTLPSTGQRSIASAFSFRRIVLQDGVVMYHDDSTGLDFSLIGLGIDASIEPNSSLSVLEFKSVSLLDSVYVLYSDTAQPVSVRFPSGAFRLNADGNWSWADQSVQVDTASLAWFDTKLAMRGSMRVHPQVREFRIAAHLTPTSLARLTESFATQVPSGPWLNLDGQVEGSLTASVTWPIPEGTVPEWGADVLLTECVWKPPHSGAAITIPRIEVHGEERTLSWRAPNGRIDNGSFSVIGSIDRLFSVERTISARLRMDAPLDGLADFVPDTIPIAPRGRLRCDVTAFGALMQPDHWRLAGDLSLDSATIVDTAWSFDSVVVSLALDSDGDKATLRRCDWLLGRSRGNASGEISGLLAAVRTRFDSPDVLHGAIDFQSGFCDVDQLLGPSPPESDSLAAIDSSASPVPAIALGGSIDCDTMVYSGLTARNVSADYQYQNHILTLDPIYARVLGGRMRGTLSWNGQNWAQPTFVTTIHADSVAADSLLSRYFDWAGGIFGQASLEGTFAGRGRYASRILPSLAADGRAEMREGRLEASPILNAVGEKLNVALLSGAKLLRDVRVPFRIVGGRIITDPLRFAAGDVAYECIGSFGWDRTLDYSVAVSVPKGGASKGLELLDGMRLGLGGTVAHPVVRVDVAQAGQNIVEKALQPAKDSASATLRRALDQFIKPKRP